MCVIFCVFLLGRGFGLLFFAIMFRFCDLFGVFGYRIMNISFWGLGPGRDGQEGLPGPSGRAGAVIGAIA